MEFKLKINQNQWRIIYKILHDIIFIQLIFFAAAIILEALLPGTIISHIGFSKIVTALFLNLFVIFLTAKKIDLGFGEISVGKLSLKKQANIIAIAVFVFSINAQLKINFLLNFFLAFLFAAISYLILFILFKKE